MENATQNVWNKHWSNAALARDAASVAQGQEIEISLSDNPYEAAMGDGPVRPATLREKFRMIYSRLRSERKEMLETPPGVG